MKSKITLLFFIVIIFTLTMTFSTVAMAAEPITTGISLSKSVFTASESVDITISIKQNMPIESISLYYPNGAPVDVFNSGLSDFTKGITWMGSWHVTESELSTGAISFTVEYALQDSDGSIVYYPETITANIQKIPANEHFTYNYFYEIQDGGTIKIIGYNGKDHVLSIPDSINNYPVVSIGKMAFDYPDEITDIIIPEGVTFLENDAFTGCNNLKTITLPNSLTQIDEFILATSSQSFTEVKVPKKHPTLSVIDGVLFDTTSNILVKYPAAKRDKSYSVPVGTQKISSLAFIGNTSIRSLTIPNTVTEIGYGAFASCSNLSSIILPQELTAISDLTFFYCNSLSDIHIPETVISIGDNAFQSCGRIKDIIIPDGVTSIGALAFADCINLQSINIPNSVVGITCNPFASCPNLKSILVEENHPTLALINNLLCDKLTRRIISCIDSQSSKQVEIPYGIDSIGRLAFSDSFMSEIIIPDTVTYIADLAFHSCPFLESIDIPDSVYYIGSSAFLNCTKLRDIHFPKHLSRISSDTFSGCSNLTSIILPDSIIEIGSKAFAECSLLKEVSLPNNLNSIDTSAFDGDSDLVLTINPHTLTMEQVRQIHMPYQYNNQPVWLQK